MDSYYGKGGKRRGKSSHPHFWKGGGVHGGSFQEDFQGKRVMDAESAMQSTTKVPPAWDPRLEKRGYPFRIWMLDVATWRVGAEIPENRQGAALLSGSGVLLRFLLDTSRPTVSVTAL